MVKFSKIQSHPIVQLGVETSLQILTIAFLVCIIVYINKINKYDIIDEDTGATAPVHNVSKSMQNFINVMAWLCLVMIGLAALFKIF